MNRKGVELSLQTVVVATVLILVLVVLIWIFVSAMQDTENNLDRCNGRCTTAEDCPAQLITGTACEDDDPSLGCCVVPSN
ncbi:MAG: hypothetical protein HC945_04055 [Nitrosarchaeum sp.]|nr:hypothetical protein [Nitrosarchaeum sp.]